MPRNFVANITPTKINFKNYRKVVCWFSGGRDSAVACYLSYHVARAMGMDYELVHIYTRTPRPSDVDTYIQQYAKWLGARLTVIMPEESFAELAKQYPYWPSLEPDKRWCYYELKLEPSIRYLEHFHTPDTLHVFAIRRSESLFRLSTYSAPFMRKCYREDLCIDIWMPLLSVDDVEIDRLISQWNIPRSPVWHKLGFSGECLCLAGATIKTIIRLRNNYPDVLEELLVIDAVIQSNRTRSKEKSFPPFLKHKRITLTEFVKSLERQATLDGYIEYNGKGCQGSCMLY